MKKLFGLAKLVPWGVLAVASSAPIVAMTLQEFETESTDTQSTYIAGAVSMMMFNESANGNIPKARCINEWYFKSSIVNGQEVVAPGPAEMAREVAKYSKLDPTYHIEELILNRTGQVCGGGAAAARSTK